MPDTVVVDLSHWNWIPNDLLAAAEAGVVGMIHKITEGTSVVDDKFGARFYLARQAKMVVGGYHFLRPGDMIRQAEFFLERLTGYMDADTLLAADYEDSRVSLHDVDDFMDAVEIRSGRSCVLYSGHVLKEAIERGDSGAADLQERRLWLAQYGPAPELPAGWDDWWLWQWTDRGTVPGIDPPCDCNDYQGADAELRAEWPGSLGEAPTPEGLVVRVIAPKGVEVIIEEA